MSESKIQAKSLFDQLIEISSPEERELFLNQNCRDDPEMRGKLEGLLKSYDAAGSFLEQPAVEAIATELVSGDAEVLRPSSSVTVPELEAQTLTFLTSSDIPELLGKLGQYEIQEVVGRGGMGIVLKGYDPKLSRVVAIKVLSPDFAANPTAHKRFLREAKAAAAVSHDHIVTIYAVEENPIPHLVMEYIDARGRFEKELLHDSTGKTASPGHRIPLPRRSHHRQHCIQVVRAAISPGGSHRAQRPEI